MFLRSLSYIFCPGKGTRPDTVGKIFRPTRYDSPHPPSPHERNETGAQPLLEPALYFQPAYARLPLYRHFVEQVARSSELVYHEQHVTHVHVDAALEFRFEEQSPLMASQFPSKRGR